MSIEVTFRNLSPREEILRRADALYKKLERFVDEATDAQLIVGIDHGEAQVELVVSSRGQTFTHAESSDELRTALDRLFHNMEHQLRRAKERRTDRRDRGERGDGFEPAHEEEDEDDVDTFVS